MSHCTANCTMQCDGSHSRGTFKVAVGAQKGGGESDLGDGNLGNDYYDV